MKIIYEDVVDVRVWDIGDTLFENHTRVTCRRKYWMLRKWEKYKKLLLFAIRMFLPLKPLHTMYWIKVSRRHFPERVFCYTMMPRQRKLPHSSGVSVAVIFLKDGLRSMDLCNNGTSERKLFSSFLLFYGKEDIVFYIHEGTLALAV